MEAGMDVQSARLHPPIIVARCRALAAIEPPELNRLGNVRARNQILLGQVGDGARDFQHAMISARGEPQPADGLLEQCGARCIGRTDLIDFTRR